MYKLLNSGNCSGRCKFIIDFYPPNQKFMHSIFTNYPTNVRASAVRIGGGHEANDDHFGLSNRFCRTVSCSVLAILLLMTVKRHLYLLKLLTLFSYLHSGCRQRQTKHAAKFSSRSRALYVWSCLSSYA